MVVLATVQDGQSRAGRGRQSQDLDDAYESRRSSSVQVAAQIGGRARRRARLILRRPAARNRKISSAALARMLKVASAQAASR